MTNRGGAYYAFLMVGSIEALRAGKFIGSEKILTGSMIISTGLCMDGTHYFEFYKAG